MQRILARLTRPPVLYDVLGILSVIVLGIGLWMVWVPACPIVLGVLLMAVGIRAASLTPDRQQTPRPRRLHKIEFLRSGDGSFGREVLMPVLPDKGGLVDPDEDDDDVADCY